MILTARTGDLKAVKNVLHFIDLLTKKLASVEHAAIIVENVLQQLSVKNVKRVGLNPQMDSVTLSALHHV